MMASPIAGELSSLAALGITTINLDATPADGDIDGQALLTQGSFSYADGTTGTFVEVAFETALGTVPDSSVVASGSDDSDPGETLSRSGPCNAPILDPNGNDTLVGDTGDDTLSGGAGNDVLTGRAGADTFKFAEMGSANSDIVTDYNYAEGDRIDLSGLLDGTGINDGNMSSYLHLLESESNIVVQVDTIGSGNFTSGTHDVATLVGIATSGNTDPVRVFFSGHDHGLVS